MPLFRGKYVLLIKHSMYKNLSLYVKQYMKYKLKYLNFWYSEKLWYNSPKYTHLNPNSKNYDSVKNGMRRRYACTHVCLPVGLSLSLPTYLCSTGNPNALKVDIKHWDYFYKLTWAYKSSSEFSVISSPWEAMLLLYPRSHFSNTSGMLLLESLQG